MCAAVMDVSTSFMLDDLEQIHIDVAASQPGRDGISTHTCRGV